MSEHNEEFSGAEKDVLVYMIVGTGGGFIHTLLAAMFKADKENFERLRGAFPLHAAAVEEWRDGDLRERALKVGYEV